MESLLKSGLGKSYMHRVLGYSYLEKENIADALKNMDLLFQKHPKDKIIPLDYMTYGKILAKDPARANEANTYFDKGIAADTAQDKVPLLRKLAEDYKDNNDYASAAVWYRKVTEQESATKEMVDYWWAGRCYYQVNDYTNANAMFGELAKQNPEEPSGYYWLAKVAAAQDPKYSTGVAVSPFKKYIEMAEGNAEKKDEIIAAETYIAVVSYNQKKYAEAKTYAQKVLSLDPSDETAKQILAGIPK